MASGALRNDPAASGDVVRVYSLCFFDRGCVVPRVQLLDAYTDEEAIEAARSTNRFKRREIWLRHRLVGILRPEN